MNIKQAKEQIKNAMTAYFSKDIFGNHKIPIERQRPIFLMGSQESVKPPLWNRLHQNWVLDWSAIP